MEKLVIVGASGHGKVIADIAFKLGYSDIVFLDDNDRVKKCGEFSVVGRSNDAFKYYTADFFVAIGNAKIRQKIQYELNNKGLSIVSLIHPAAVIAPNVKIGIGTVVMAGAVINPHVEIGEGCIINTCASVDHDSILGDFSHISVGAHVAGTVKIGARAWIGAGATISNNVNIVSDCMVGAGAVVVKDLLETDTYVGVPAKKIKKVSLV